ncbi:CMGC/CK2 protein kinase [Anncaliia algerae PRA339]|uniref:Casein kinase II subunit alpha n=1 Tax=Anncaliia algerae PRA339 TaxID=1288291 RepID=A0A059F281_9MICR|nr:CMGC/CK2 protein kinase [Anncaliia algerae PRA339]
MVKISVARENSDYNKLQAEEYYNYTDYKLEFGDIENYRIYKRMARGKYSEVFEGRAIDGIDDSDPLIKNKKRYKKIVIKVLKPIKIAKVNREVKILKSLEHENIIGLLDVVVDFNTQTHSLIFEYLNHENTLTIFENANEEDIIHYSRQILLALEHAHSKGIMHRDIKPQNILIDPETRHLKVIDWGLAEFYHPGNCYPVRVATRYYKGPELLVGYGYYNYSLDIWSFGCLFAELLFGKRPIFAGKDDINQLAKIVEILGRTDLIKYCSKYEIKLSNEVNDSLEESKKRDWEDVFEKNKAVNRKKDAIDLLNKIIVYDHSTRLTARECLQHPFFRSN